MSKIRHLHLTAITLLVSTILSGCGTPHSKTSTTTTTTSITADTVTSSSTAPQPMATRNPVRTIAAAHLDNPFEAAAFSIIPEREIQGLNADIQKMFGAIPDKAAQKIFEQAHEDCKSGAFDKAVDGYSKAVAALPALKRENINRGNNPIIELHIAMLQYGALDCSKFGQPSKGLKLLTDAETFAATLPGPASYEKSFIIDAHCAAKAGQFERALSDFKSIEKSAGSVATKAHARVAQARMLEKMGKVTEAGKVRGEAQNTLDTANGVEQLISACQAGNLAQVEKLVKSGISAKGFGESRPRHLSSYSPLMNTIMAGDKPDIVEFLLNNGADVNEADFKGATPLHLAAKYNAVKTAGILLAHKANVEAVCADVDPGKFSVTNVDHHLTPLLIAAQNNNLDMVRLLVEVGHANVEAENSDRNNAADVATETNVLAYLVTKRLKLNSH
ncbi:MAG: ankyrin repeat domain-containing protein [Candidatus Obscuribacterales bacterium]|nr:ankyrin repeat domain-containing protein [Candidatus Obscuribacterales bacterium]